MNCIRILGERKCGRRTHATHLFVLQKFNLIASRTSASANRGIADREILRKFNRKYEALYEK